MSDQAPWALVDDDRERAGTVLYVGLRCIDSLKILFAPFLPSRRNRSTSCSGTTASSPGRCGSGRSRRTTDAPQVVLTGDYDAWVGPLGAE